MAKRKIGAGGSGRRVGGLSSEIGERES